MENITIAIARQARKRRAELKLRQDEIALFAEMTVEKYRALEGGTYLPTAGELLDLSKALRVSAAFLLSLSGDMADRIRSWEEDARSGDPAARIDAVHSITQAILPYTYGPGRRRTAPDIAMARRECDRLLDGMDFARLREALRLLAGLAA